MKNWLNLAGPRGYMVSAVIVSLLLIGCKDEDCSISYNKADLIGDWLYESGDFAIGLELDSDGDFGIAISEGVDTDYSEGSWTLSGDIVTLTYEPDGEKETVRIIHLTDEEMGVVVEGEAYVFYKY